MIRPKLTKTAMNGLVALAVEAEIALGDRGVSRNKGLRAFNVRVERGIRYILELNTWHKSKDNDV